MAQAEMTGHAGVVAHGEDAAGGDEAVAGYDEGAVVEG